MKFFELNLVNFASAFCLSLQKKVLNSMKFFTDFKSKLIASFWACFVLFCKETNEFISETSATEFECSVFRLTSVLTVPRNKAKNKFSKQNIYFFYSSRWILFCSHTKNEVTDDKIMKTATTKTTNDERKWKHTEKTFNNKEGRAILLYCLRLYCCVPLV